MSNMEDFHFDERKAAQAAAYFAKKAGGEINYMKLIKLLYLADREAIKRWNFPIVGGHYVSMDNGPVTSPIYDAIKSPDLGFPAWKNLFRKAGYDLILTSEPEFADLSRAEMEALDFIEREFGDKGEWDLVYYTHEKCPEWSDPQGSSIPIDPEEILRKIGKTPGEIAVAKEEAAKFSVIERLLLKSP